MRFDTFAETHWTDEQLIDSLYGVGPQDDHPRHCRRCSSRQALLVSNRQAIESSPSNAETVDDQFLAVQRHAIWEKLDRGISRSLLTGLRRLAPVSLALLLISGGLATIRSIIRVLATNRPTLNWRSK